MQNAIEIVVNVKTRIWREGKAWIADCPALGVVVQMDSAKAVQAEFRQVVSAVLDMNREQGTLPELLRYAAAHPETLWTPVDAAAKTIDVEVPLPVSYLVAAHVQQKAA